MKRKWGLPFKVGQEVEAKFNESGYRGAWFRCLILEIKEFTAGPSLLLKYLDFPDEANSWAPVLQSFPAFKVSWGKEKKTFWMVRPKPPIIHESEVEKHQGEIRMGRECPGHVYIYNHTYMVGDTVDWWKDDCYWIAKILKIESDTNTAKLRFPPSPHGEGKTDMAPLKNLRPSFTWTPKRQWRQMGLKRNEERNGIQGYKSCKSPVQLVYFSEDSVTPILMSGDSGGPFSSRNTASDCEPDTDGVAVDSRGTPGEERHKSTGSHELVVTSDTVHEEPKCVLVSMQSILDSGDGTKQHVVFSRSKLSNRSITSGAISSVEEESPEEVKLKNVRRKVLPNSSFSMSDSDEEEQRSYFISRNRLAADGARPSESDSEMGTEYELVDLISPTTHSERLGASTALSPLVATSPTEGEMNSSATRVIADETTGELETTGSLVEFDTTPEHLRNGIAVGVNNTVPAAYEGFPPLEFVIPDVTPENAGCTHCTPSDAHDRNDTLSEVADIVTVYDTGTYRSAGTKDSPCSDATDLAVNSPEGRDTEISSMILELVADDANRPVESVGTFMTMENADESGDPTFKGHVNGSNEPRSQVHLLVPAGTTTELKIPPSLDSIAGCVDGLSDARGEVYSLAHGKSTAPQVECTDSAYDSDNKIAEGASNEGRLEVHLIVSSENRNALKNPRSTDITAVCTGFPTDTRAETEPLALDDCTAYPEEITENTLDFDSVVPGVYQTAPDHGALLYLVPDDIRTSIRRGDDEVEGTHNEVVVSALTLADSEEAQLQFQSLEKIPTPHMTTCAARKEKCLGRIRVLDTGSQANDCESDVFGKEVCKQKLDGSVLAVASMCSLGADHMYREDDGPLSIVCTIPVDDRGAIPDFHRQQATGIPTEEVSVPRTGQMKLLSHRSCVAIKKAINIGRSWKRRQETGQSVTNPKRVCQIERNQGVDLSSFQTVGFMQEPLSSSVPSTPANKENRMFAIESIVKPEPIAYESENKTLLMDDSIHEPLWVLALPRIREGKIPAVVKNIPPTTPSDSEHQCRPANDEIGLEDDLDALERLTARVHVLGGLLRGRKVQKRKKVVWKIGDGNLFFSAEGEAAVLDAEANGFNDISNSWDRSDLNYIPEWYLQSVSEAAHVSAEALDLEARALNSDSDYVPERQPHLSTKVTNMEDTDMLLKFRRDSQVTCGMKSRSRRKVTKRVEKRSKDLQNQVTHNALSLRQPETANRFLLLGSENMSSKVNCGLKRNQADFMESKDCKKRRLDVNLPLVEAVDKSATPSAEVDLPRMRGSIKNLKEKPERSKKRPLKDIMGRKEKLLSAGFEEQQLESSHCEDIEQKSIGNSSLCGLPTKSHLSSGSNHDIPSPRNSDSEIFDTESEENKVRLQSNGNWCIKAHTVDGKLEWIGSYPTKEAALSVYDIVNGSSCLRLKDVPPLSHTSFSSLRERADGDHLSREHMLNEKQLKCNNLDRSNKCNASESSSTAVEPIAGSAVFIVKEADRTAVDVSRPEKTARMDKQKGEDHGAGAVANISKSVEACEQDSSVISTKEDASIRKRVETDSGFSMEGNIQESGNTQVGETAHNLSAGHLVSSCKVKVMNVDRVVQSGGIVQGKYPVKVEVSEPQVVAAADSAHDSWIHDAVKCQSGKDILDRVSVNFFETREEIEVARRAKMALWRGICCSPQDAGLVSRGLDLFKVIQLWKSRMHIQDLIDGDAFKVLLSTGKSGEEIYIGHFKTAKEVDAVRKILYRCKKEFAKSIGVFEVSEEQQVSSGVLQMKASHAGTSQEENSSSLAEAGNIRARPIATYPTADPSMREVAISGEVGRSLTRTEISPKICSAAGDLTPKPASGQIPCSSTLHVTHKGRDTNIQASAAPVADHLPYLNERQVNVNPRTVATPPGYASVQNVIILDDDDDDEMDVPPVPSIPPSLATATPVGTISGSLNNISIQPNSSLRENSTQGIPISMTHGQSSDVMSSFSRQIQEERCRLTGVSSAGTIRERETVPSADSGMDPIQSVAQGCGIPGAEIHGRASTQPPRQEWSGSRHTSPRLVAGNVVGPQQHVNRYGGTVRVNIVSSSGLQVEMPSSNLQASQGSVRVTTSHVPESYTREVGGFSSLPTAFNSSAAAALGSNMERKFYNCCPSIGSCEEDFMLFKALRCRVCNRLMHTECAMTLGQLRLRRNRTGQELAYYECACGRPWGIVPNILSRMKEFIQLIWRLQAAKLNQYLASPVRVIDLHKGPELRVIMSVLHKILFGAKTDPMLTIFGNIEKMSRDIFTDANRVNYLEWLTFISNALIRLGGSGHANQTVGRG